MRCTPKTLEHYDYTLGGFTDYLAEQGIDDVTEITPHQIRAYLVCLQQRGLKNTAQHIHARGIRAGLNWLVLEGELRVPADLVSGLRDWHESLLSQIHDVVQRTENNGNPVGDPHVVITYSSDGPQVLSIADETLDICYAYDDALKGIVRDLRGMLLDSSYGRMADRALRVAMLLAGVSGENTVVPRHWARAQQIVERWRAGLHHAWTHIRTAEKEDREESLEKTILTSHVKMPGLQSIRYVTLNWKAYSKQQIIDAENPPTELPHLALLGIPDDVS